MRKQRYAKKLYANRAAKILGERHGLSYRIYKCPDCQGFHLTTQL